MKLQSKDMSQRTHARLNSVQYRQKVEGGTGISITDEELRQRNKINASLKSQCHFALNPQL